MMKKILVINLFIAITALIFILPGSAQAVDCGWTCSNGTATCKSGGTSTRDGWDSAGNRGKCTESCSGDAASWQSCDGNRVWVSCGDAGGAKRSVGACLSAPPATAAPTAAPTPTPTAAPVPHWVPPTCKGDNETNMFFYGCKLTTLSDEEALRTHDGDCNARTGPNASTEQRDFCAEFCDRANQAERNNLCGPAGVPTATGFQKQCSADGTQATFTWNPVNNIRANNRDHQGIYNLRFNAPPGNTWIGTNDMFVSMRPSTATPVSFTSGHNPSNDPTVSWACRDGGTASHCVATANTNIVLGLSYVSASLQVYSSIGQRSAYAGVNLKCDPAPFVCDFNDNRIYDDGDVTFWKRIFSRVDNDSERTTKADCSGDSRVDLVDFNRWRNMKYLGSIGN